MLVSPTTPQYEKNSKENRNVSKEKKETKEIIIETEPETKVTIEPDLCGRKMPDSVLEFAKVTTVHGLSEWINASNSLIRLTWSISLICTFAFLSYTMFLVLIDCIEEKTTVTTHRQATTKFPKVTYCPEEWINPTKTQEYGLDQPMAIYLESLMISMVKRRDIEDAGLTKDEINEAANRLNTVVNKKFSGRLEDLLDAVSYEPSEILQLRNKSKQMEKLETLLESGLVKKSADADEEVSISKQISTTGVCYHVETFVNFNAYFMQMAALTLTLFHHNQQTRQTRPEMSFNQISFGEPNPFGHAQQHPLTSHSNYHIRVGWEIIRQTSIRRSPCSRSISRLESQICAAAVYNENCAQSSGCQIFFPQYKSYTNISVLSYCSWFQPDQFCLDQLNTLLSADNDGCMSPCDQTLYTVIPIPFGKSQKSQLANGKVVNATVIRISLDNPNEISVQTTSRVCTLQNTVAELGGIMGLLCGASLLSVVQIFTFFCSSPCTKEEKK